MGLSGIILRKNADADLHNLKNVMFEIFDSLSYEYYDWNEMSKGENYNSISVRKKDNTADDECFVMYLYNDFDSQESIQFNWIDMNLDLIILIENISGCEEMILEILFKYLKLYPNDVFYNEMKWYYNQSDIERIYNSDKQREWCYLPPKNE